MKNVIKLSPFGDKCVEATDEDLKAIMDASTASVATGILAKLKASSDVPTHLNTDCKITVLPDECTITIRKHDNKRSVSISRHALNTILASTDPFEIEGILYPLPISTETPTYNVDILSEFIEVEFIAYAITEISTGARKITEYRSSGSSDRYASFSIQTPNSYKRYVFNMEDINELTHDFSEDNILAVLSKKHMSYSLIGQLLDTAYEFQYTEGKYTLIHNSKLIAEVDADIGIMHDPVKQEEFKDTYEITDDNRFIVSVESVAFFTDRTYLVSEGVFMRALFIGKSKTAEMIEAVLDSEEVFDIEPTHRLNVSEDFIELVDIVKQEAVTYSR